MDLFATVFEGDALSITLALALLAMSVASWTVIFYKAWLLHRVSADVAHGKAAFWQARDVAQALQALASVDRSVVLLPLAQANQQLLPGTLGAQGDARNAGADLVQQVHDILLRSLAPHAFEHVLVNVLERDVDVAADVFALGDGRDAEVLELAGRPDVDDALWPAALTATNGQKVSITRTPPNGTAITRTCFIEGIRHEIVPASGSGQGTWRVTWRLADATAWAGYTSDVWDTGVWDTAKWFY